MTKMLAMAPNFSMEAREYAIQKNAILGIPNSGKSYSGTKAAEQLMDAGIQIIAIDPVGVWKNLKIGNNNKPGYPIVVAGGKGSDIILTKENTAEIVKAALRERVSLVIDLYSRELSTKSTWIKIVEIVIHTLMYENDDHILRHVFIEEAGEFIPQRIQPQQNKVYSAIESMARMGRNMGLGMTVINQRAEDINKSILELCEISFIHKQTGKNSLKAMQQWFKLREIDQGDTILKDLPKLEKGQCWIVRGEAKALRIKVSAKKTFHPSADKGKGAIPTGKTSMADVSKFVDRMNKSLAEPVKQEPNKPGALPTKAAIKEQNKIAELNKELIAVKGLYSGLVIAHDELHHRYEFLENKYNVLVGDFNKAKDTVASALAAMKDASGFIFNGKPAQKLKSSIQPGYNSRTTEYPVPNKKKLERINKPVQNNTGLNKCPREILTFLASYQTRSFTKVQIAIGSGYSHNSSGFVNAISELNTKGLIQKLGNRIQVNMANAKIVLGDFTPMVYNRESFMSKLQKCEREIYQVLLENESELLSKEQIAELTPTQYSVTSSGFANALSRLCTLELAMREAGQIRLHPDVVELS